MLSVKQGGIKYHFFSLWYDSSWDWNPGYRTIGAGQKKLKLLDLLEPKNLS